MPIPDEAQVGCVICIGDDDSVVLGGDTVLGVQGEKFCYEAQKCGVTLSTAEQSFPPLHLWSVSLKVQDPDGGGGLDPRIHYLYHQLFGLLYSSLSLDV